MAPPLKRVVEALTELTQPGEAWTAQSSQENVLRQTLCHNLLALDQKLQQDSNWATLQQLREQVISQLTWAVRSDDVVWNFVSEVLVQLLCLKQTMIELLVQFVPPKPNPKSPECAPALPPDTLSISQQKIVQTALQFVVILGICPYLLPGVGTPLRCRSDFAATVEKLVCYLASPRGMWRLHVVTMALLDVAQHSSLESLILTRHLGDLLASLCQLAYSPNKYHLNLTSEEYSHQEDREKQKGLTDAEQHSCQQALRNLLDRVYQPIVVKELLILQGGTKQMAPACVGKTRTFSQTPSWLRRRCGQLLSERLMKPNGIQAVVRGIVEGAGTGIAGGQSAEAAAADWRKCDVVARILASCPQQCLSVEEYYRQVCPQVLDLFHIKDKLTACQFQRVATMTFLSMVKEQPELADKYLLKPLLAPLICCLENKEMVEGSRQVGTVIVEESELTCCVDDIYKVYVVGNDPCSKLLESLKAVIPAIFSLYCFTTRGVSHLRSGCQEILLWFLQKSEPPVAMLVLKQLAGLAQSSPIIHPLYHFTAGSEGGVKLTVKETVSDEDEILYKKVSSEQWRIECLAQLLSNLQENNLTGDFFIECLKGLTCLAGETDDRLATSRSDGLPELEQREQQLVILQLIAVLCERFGHLILNNTVHVIEFVITTLDRCCVNLMHQTEETVEAQTLSMGMGLIASMLGGAVQLTSTDFDAMKPMLPRLEQIAVLHPDPVIQELASDLRITVATHGAFSTETVVTAAQSTMGNQNKQDDKPTKSSHPKETCPVTRSQRQSPTSHSVGAMEHGNMATPGNSPRNFHQILQIAFDPEVPTRAAALRTISQMVRQRNPDALSNQEKVLLVFLENLKHEDSFVYLSAIQGLSVLADVYPAQILPRLLDEYRISPEGAEKTRCVETRMKMGEVLMRSTKALGEIASHYRDPLIRVFLMGTKDSDSTVRASSLSNLGELCQCLQFAVGSVIHEVTECLTGIVKTEREPEVRRAAIHVITLLLRGLSEKTLQVLDEVLRDLYRLLKYVIQADEDEVVVVHAQIALEELDHIVRRFLFPEENLQKKIVILP
ncbi:transport and Golgi organization protein 6 homolog isoform X2 [Stegostoma tigrinum]|uniref:transport and Golgi organization protein 6 homolog isoform X2 n=1 Tax=Stegostoma tigrinum TaxID=3053191 RepID=UPI00286FF351|nr:transport and Golgi organization protein 6 homolog isoform X2 [Stegostoma tigrinum]